MDKIIHHKYGEFKDAQIDYYQEKLRKKIFNADSSEFIISTKSSGKSSNPL